MNTITEIQYKALVSKIYGLLMSLDDMGMGEMGNCHEAAELTVNDWLTENNIEVI